MIIKDQYKKVQDIYKKKMTDMQDMLGKETNKMQVAEQRRKLELEGYSSDLNAMKKKIAFYQKYIVKLKKLVDDEQPVYDNEDNDSGEEENENE